MKVSILRESLLKAAGLVNQVIGYKTDLPVLSNFHIKAESGQLSIVGTNLESTIETKLPAKVEEKGQTTAPARLLIDFYQGLKSDQVNLCLIKDELELSAEGARAKLPTISPQEFPKIEGFEKNHETKFEKEEFLDSVNQTAFCAAPEEGRPVLTGILITPGRKTTEFVATDGYRLSRKEVGLNTPLKVLIPARALKEAAKIVSEQPDEVVVVSVSKDSNQAKIETKNTSLTTRLLDGDYPNYEQIIPASFPTELLVSKEKLAEAVRLAALFARDVGNVVKVSLKDQKILVSANTAQVGEAEAILEGKVSGDEIQIAFNSRFLLEPLSAIKSREISISFSGPATAALIKGKEDKGLIYIVMPVRTQS